MKIEKGDIVEVINLKTYDGINNHVTIGSRFIAVTSPYPKPYPHGQINVIAPGHAATTQEIILVAGQYTLYRKNPLKEENESI